MQLSYSTLSRRVRAPAGDAAGPHQPRDRARLRAQPLRQVDPQHLGVQEGSARTGGGQITTLLSI